MMVEKDWFAPTWTLASTSGNPAWKRQAVLEDDMIFIFAIGIEVAKVLKIWDVLKKMDETWMNMIII